MHYFLKNQLSLEKSDENFTLIIEDGNALFYALKGIARNFQEICLKLFRDVSSKTCGVILSTAMYHADSNGKTQERKWR